MRLRLRAIAAWCASALLLAAAGCGVPRRQEAVTIVHAGRPLTLDPHAHRELLTRSVLANCFEGLVGFDPDMRIVPLLAERWENPDELTWVFHLRAGVKFHNGKPMTANAAVTSLWRAGRNSTSQIQSQMELVDTVYAGDSLTVVLRTGRANAILLNRLTKLAILSEEPSQAVQTDSGMTEMPAGTGPYVITSWRKDGGMEMTRWSGYWGAPPSAPLLRLVFVSGHEQSAELLRRGQADIVAGIEPDDRRALTSLPGIRLLSRPGLAVRYLRVDPTFKPYSDPAVRRAISLAIDRQLLVDSVAAGYGHPAGQMVTPAVFGCNPALQPQRPQPDSARTLMSAAGYRIGQVLELDVLDTRRELGRLIQRQLNRAGFACSLVVHDRESFFRGTGRKSRFYLSALVANSGDASDVLMMGDVDRNRLATAAGIMDPGRRQEALQKHMAEFTARSVFIPLYSEDDISAVSDRVIWQPRLDMMVLGKEIKLKHLDTDFLR